MERVTKVQDKLNVICEQRLSSKIKRRKPSRWDVDSSLQSDSIVNVASEKADVALGAAAVPKESAQLPNDELARSETESSETDDYDDEYFVPGQQVDPNDQPDPPVKILTIMTTTNLTKTQTINLTITQTITPTINLTIPPANIPTIFPTINLTITLMNILSMLTEAEI